jgi:Fur family ferric uptake transcriptional regulator
MQRLMTAQTDLMAILEDRGYRSTGPRRDVIDALEKRLDSFSAEDISGELPGVGRATVYRTIKLLLEAGVLCKLILPNGKPTYTIARLEHHHHTLCVRCGTVGEFRDATIERLLRAIGGDISGEIVGHRMEFFITCERCLAGSAV